MSDFREGDLVTTTPLALANGVFKKHHNGEIAVTPIQSRTVSVLVDGRKQPDQYSVSFWKRYFPPSESWAGARITLPESSLRGFPRDIRDDLSDK